MNDDSAPPLDLPPDLQALLDAAGVTDEESLQRALANNAQLRERFEQFVEEQQRAQADAAITALLDAVPEELRARLHAAGAGDMASLQDALGADPQLKSDLEAFLAARRAEATPGLIEDYLATFAAAVNSGQLMELWNQIPLDLEQPFLDVVEARIARSEQEGDAELAENLRERRDALRQLLDEGEAAAARIAQDVARLETAEDGKVAAAIWNELPIDLEEPFLDAAERRAAELGDTPRAVWLRAQIAAMRQARRQREELAQQPPAVRALRAFFHAETDDAARTVFAERKALLQPYEAQRMADGAAANAPDELRERFAVRAALLRELRGAVPHPQQPVPHQDERVGLEQADSTTLIRSAQAIGEGATAKVYNITNINLLQRSWTRRRPPRLQREVVARPKELDEVRSLLQAHGGAVIGAHALGVQGMPGVGKTTLANLLALDLDAVYPDGVLWEVIGPEIRSPDQVQPILDRWGLLAVGVSIDPEAPPRFEAEAVRALLGEHPRLLVVLDNVWSKEAIAPLQMALPSEAHLLITTRSRQLLTQLQVPAYLLDVLRSEDARALAALRLGWGAEVPASEQGWVDTLIESVGRHTLALDVALGMLCLQSDTAEEWASDAKRISTFVRSGAGFGELQLGDDDREHHVELVLQYSYDHALDETARQRFRLLGVFAPDAEFSTPYAAALWGCDETEARRQLNAFVNAALLNRGGATGRWQQHALLRGYALALLRRAAEYEAAAAQHAERYSAAMREADDRQRFYEMLPEAPQLRHAFAWAIENDLGRAQGLIGDCAELQAAFGLAREGLGWCEQALAAARQRGTGTDLARAWGSLGNAQSRVATLPGENRRERLLAALAAYDEALRFRTPETAPLDFAMMQNNRATILSEIATLPGENRRERLLAALAAYDEALRFYTPETAPLAFAMTQNNRANLLSEIATLPGENRRERLLAALAAYDEALRWTTPTDLLMHPPSATPSPCCERPSTPPSPTG